MRKSSNWRLLSDLSVFRRKPSNHASISAMSQRPKVFVLVLAGHERDALAFVKQRYSACESVLLSKTDLRKSGGKNQLRKLRQLQGEALVIFTDSLKFLREPMLLKWSVILHRCRETVLADSSGAFELVTKSGLLRLLPRSFIAALADMAMLVGAWIGLQLFRIWLKLGRELQIRHGLFDVALLCPSPAGLDNPGGAQTHITGFLSGLMQEEARVAVFSGQPLPIPCEIYPVSGCSDFHLFREAATL